MTGVARRHEPRTTENPPAETEPEVDRSPSRRRGSSAPVDEDFDDIPIISQEMLHHERVDFEAGMKVIPPVTLALMLACIAVYLRQIWIGGLLEPCRVVATGAMDRDRGTQRASSGG